MAIRIVEADLITNYTWEDIKDSRTWGILRNSNTTWQSILQVSEPAQNIKIEIEVTEGTWSSVKELLPVWSFVKNKFTNWSNLRNW